MTPLLDDASKGMKTTALAELIEAGFRSKGSYGPNPLKEMAFHAAQIVMSRMEANATLQTAQPPAEILAAERVDEDAMVKAMVKAMAMAISTRGNCSGCKKDKPPCDACRDDARVALAAIKPTLARLAAERDAAIAERDRLRQIIGKCNWYWRAGDRECSYSCPSAILDEVDRGEIVEIYRGGVVETRFMATLPPAPDALSDDDFEVDCETRAEAEAAVEAEIARRAALGDKP